MTAMIAGTLRPVVISVPFDVLCVEESIDSRAEGHMSTMIDGDRRWRDVEMMGER
jgi:hypothetical protein